MSLHQNDRRRVTRVQLPPWLSRAKALGPTGVSEIIFMFLTDCKWNKIPPSSHHPEGAKALERCVGFTPREMPPQAEPVAS